MNTKRQNLIQTYIIQVNSQTGDKERTSGQFESHDEFFVNFVEPFAHDDKTISLKKTIQQIIKQAVELEDNFILICNNDHQFADCYHKDILFEAIDQAKKLNADVLCGGMNLFRSAIRISENIFWMEDFSGLRFVIIFRAYYQRILESDNRILPPTNAKFFVYPFLSGRGEVGSDDISSLDFNTNSGEDCSVQVTLLDKVSAFYRNMPDVSGAGFDETEYDDITIPTYIINLPERTDRLANIKKQFSEKKEFDVQIIEACKHPIGAVGLWESIRKIVHKAIADDDDIIIICEDDHEFTSQYSKAFLLKNIIEAHEQQTEMLAGGICEFHKALPITLHRAWVSTSFCIQFTVLFKPAFKKIIDEPYDDHVTADAMLSYLISNKMVLYPFISAQRHFGYSDVTQHNNENTELLEQSFIRESERLNRIYEAKAVYADV